MVLSGVRVARSLVFWVVFCRSLFVLLSFFFWPFWLPLWYLQTLPTYYITAEYSSKITDGLLLILLCYWIVNLTQFIISVSKASMAKNHCLTVVIVATCITGINIIIFHFVSKSFNCIHRVVVSSILGGLSSHQPLINVIWHRSFCYAENTLKVWLNLIANYSISYV